MRVNWAVLPLRLAIGVVFIAHGSQKLFGWFGGYGIAKTAEGFGHMGLHPAIFWAWVVAIAEFFGGLGLVGGLLTRLSALGLTIDMIVAIVKVHLKNGFFVHEGGFEFPMMLLATALALLILGAGDYSIDALIARWWKSHRKPAGEGRT
jgi:putative oxidoreductase